MKKIPVLLGGWLLFFLAGGGFAGSFELGTAIVKKGDAVTLTGSGYTRLVLVRFQINRKGSIRLNGHLSVNRGPASLVMWSKVEGKFYFSRLPALQNIGPNPSMPFSIPFSSPKDPVTEIVLEVELPMGGEITLDHLGIDGPDGL